MVISGPTPDEPQQFPAQHWQSLGTSGNLDAPEVDCETAALFRASLRPLISQSISWPGLMDALRLKGFGLVFRGGRLFLTNHTTGSRICSLRFIGMPLADLVSQLGRPIVRALPGQRADGELLREPPAAPVR